MFETDGVGVLARELLRERARDLIAEVCAWAVGLSDRPFYLRRHGRVVATGATIGTRAAAGQPLTPDEDAPLEIGASPPGTFGDALGALTGDGRSHAERLEEQVIAPFALDVALDAAARVRSGHPQMWAELVDEVGEDDVSEMVAVAEWHVPVRLDAEHLVVAALGPVPLIEVEAEGLPLSLVRAAEEQLQQATIAPDERGGVGQLDVAPELTGALFLAEAALQAAVGAGDIIVPVAPDAADVVARILGEQDLEPQEAEALLAVLPVHADTAEVVLRLLADPDVR